MLSLITQPGCCHYRVIHLKISPPDTPMLLILTLIYKGGHGRLVQAPGTWACFYSLSIILKISVCMCVCVCVCACACVRACACMCLCVCVHMCLYMRACMRRCMHVCVCVCVYACLHFVCV